MKVTQTFAFVARVEYMELSSTLTTREQVLVLRGADGLLIEVDLTFVTDEDATMCSDLLGKLQTVANKRCACAQCLRSTTPASTQIYALVRDLKVELQPGVHTTYFRASRAGVRARDVTFYVTFVRPTA